MASPIVPGAPTKTLQGSSISFCRDGNIHNVPGGFSLTDRCPRLARARDDWNRFAEYERQLERNRADTLLNAERLLAHRELQLVRAYRTNDGRYIRERQRELAASERKVVLAVVVALANHVRP